MTEAPASASPATAPDQGRARSLYKFALPLLAVGAILSILALAIDSERSRLGFGYLLGFAFIWTIVLGSLFFVALQHVTR